MKCEKKVTSASEICSEVAARSKCRLIPEEEADRGDDLVRGVRGEGAQVPLSHVQDILVSTSLELHFPHREFLETGRLAVTFFALEQFPLLYNGWKRIYWATPLLGRGDSSCFSPLPRLYVTIPKKSIKVDLMPRIVSQSVTGGARRL